MTEKEFLQLLNKNQGIIHKVCRMYTRYNPDYQDLFQEIVLQLWKSIGSFKGSAKITTWMYRVALFTAFTYLKRKKPLEYSLTSEYESKIAEEINQERDDLLTRAMKFLKDDEKALVMLILEEKSYKEIADILGITENNVGVRFNRIKKKLKDIITSWN